MIFWETEASGIRNCFPYCTASQKSFACRRITQSILSLGTSRPDTVETIFDMGTTPFWGFVMDEGVTPSQGGKSWPVWRLSSRYHDESASWGPRYYPYLNVMGKKKHTQITGLRRKCFLRTLKKRHAAKFCQNMSKTRRHVSGFWKKTT